MSTQKPAQMLIGALFIIAKTWKLPSPLVRTQLSSCGAVAFLRYCVYFDRSGVATPRSSAACGKVSATAAEARRRRGGPGWAGPRSKAGPRAPPPPPPKGPRDARRRGGGSRATLCLRKEEPSSKRLRDGAPSGSTLATPRWRYNFSCGIQQRMKNYNNFFCKRYEWENFGYPEILFPYRLLQDIDYSSLCYTVGACWLSVLYLVACIC
nr:uncharacterized protein LOC131752797 [Kogia breviceps]